MVYFSIALGLSYKQHTSAGPFAIGLRTLTDGDGTFFKRPLDEARRALGFALDLFRRTRWAIAKDMIARPSAAASAVLNSRILLGEGFGMGLLPFHGSPRSRRQGLSRSQLSRPLKVFRCIPSISKVIFRSSLETSQRSICGLIHVMASVQTPSGEQVQFDAMPR